MSRDCRNIAQGESQRLLTLAIYPPQATHGRRVGAAPEWTRGASRRNAASSFSDDTFGTQFVFTLERRCGTVVWREWDMDGLLSTGTLRS